MIELRKIIWASDGSDESENALNYATLIAKKYKSEILGVYVSIKRLKNLPVDFRHLSNKRFYSLVQRAEENRTANFNSVATKLASQGITFEGKGIWGEKSKKILEIAGREKADLIGGIISDGSAGIQSIYSLCSNFYLIFVVHMI